MISVWEKATMPSSVYPAPARFVNHSDEPSCVEDFDWCCDVALRDIAKGEPVTIDAAQETWRELGTSLDAYTGAWFAVCSVAQLPDRRQSHPVATRASRPRSRRSSRRAPGVRASVAVRPGMVRRHRTLGGRRFRQHADRRAPSAPHHAGQARPRQLAAGLPTRRLNSHGSTR